MYQIQKSLYAEFERNNKKWLGLLQITGGVGRTFINRAIISHRCNIIDAGYNLKGLQSSFLFAKEKGHSPSELCDERKESGSSFIVNNQLYGKNFELPN